MRVHRIEARTGSAERTVAAVAEIPHRKVAPWELTAHARLDVAEVILPLDQRIADEQDAIAILDVEFSVGSEERDAHEGAEDGDGDEAEHGADTMGWSVEVGEANIFLPGKRLNEIGVSERRE